MTSFQDARDKAIEADEAKETRSSYCKSFNILTKGIC